MLSDISPYNHKSKPDLKGLKIVCIGGKQHCCDKFIDCTPFDVISYFKNAHTVITDTFHGTIISIITHQRFATFIRNSGYGNSEKVSDLLNRLKLTSQIVSNEEELERVAEQNIDYRPVDHIIATEREKAYQFLQNVLKRGKDDKHE